MDWGGLGQIGNDDVFLASATVLSFAVLLPYGTGGEDGQYRFSSLGQRAFFLVILLFTAAMVASAFHTLAAFVFLIASILVAALLNFLLTFRRQTYEQVKEEISTLQETLDLPSGSAIAEEIAKAAAQPTPSKRSGAHPHPRQP